MTTEDVPPADGDEPDQPEQPAVPLNRAARRGHARKNGGVDKAPGRPHQNTFVGRRVFRRTSGG
ncbi:hypothetical protein ACIGNX_03320 [Actinosynnema sp. NPDC053489]|uniref:hypothetical protein n=1 Tax=Actinosynnema sp. NPDC053489 TaxID=3363916 RepID=UPI0037CA975D